MPKPQKRRRHDSGPPRATSRKNRPEPKGLASPPPLGRSDDRPARCPELTPPLDWRLGTMGFGYSDWSGVFYPRDLKPSDFLAFYARYFNAVELDTTFHAIPPPDRVRRWRDETPGGFRFAAKAPKAVTHEGILDHHVDPMFEFLDSIGQLGEKLAVVLLQFPPSFTVQQLPRLRTFAGAMPEDVRFAVEFRHPSRDSEATAELLRERNWCWAAADYAGEPR